MAKITVQDTTVKTLRYNDNDYICITDVARQKNPVEPKDVVKNWMRIKNTLEYLGIWEKLNNPNFRGVEFDPLLTEAGNNSFTMSPSRWVETTGAIGIVTKTGTNAGTYAQKDIAFKLPHPSIPTLSVTTLFLRGLRPSRQALSMPTKPTC